MKIALILIMMPILLLSPILLSTDITPKDLSTIPGRIIPNLSKEQEVFAIYFMFKEFDLLQQEYLIYLFSMHYKNYPYLVDCIIKKYETLVLEENDAQ